LRESVDDVLDTLVVLDVVVAEDVLEDDGHQLSHVLLQDGLRDCILCCFVWKNEKNK
jgi:hypothetical protein